MNDQAHYRDQRMLTAKDTGCPHAATRGWNFDQAVDDVPIAIRALAEIVRPRSLVMLAVIGFVSSLFWF